METGFNFKKYFSRAGKYFIYLILMLVIIIGIFTLTSKAQDFRYENLFRPGTGGQMLLFLVAISLIYPLFGFTRKKVYINRSYAEEKEKIKEIFFNNRYVVVSEEQNRVEFRHSSTFVRFMRMFEDTIVIDGSDNPIVLEGPRRDLLRFARHIEYVLKDTQE